MGEGPLAGKTHERVCGPYPKSSSFRPRKKEARIHQKSLSAPATPIHTIQPPPPLTLQPPPPPTLQPPPPPPLCPCPASTSFRLWACRLAQGTEGGVYPQPTLLVQYRAKKSRAYEQEGKPIQRKKKKKESPFFFARDKWCTQAQKLPISLNR